MTKACGVYSHAHAGKTCRCMKLCSTCGEPEAAHSTWSFDIRLADGGSYPIGPWISDEMPGKKFLCIPESI